MLFNENGISFKLDQKTFTAKVIRSPDARGIIFIPRSIRYQMQDYLITSIQPKSFKSNNCIISIDFPKDSAIQKICKKAFSYSLIERITIPPSLDDLEEGWCAGTSELVHVSLLPGNKRYKFLDNDNKIIIGKSDLNSDIYDTLVFACRDTDKIFIPSTIKHISSYAFSSCTIKLFEYDENSQLETIGKKVFQSASINNFFIPPTLKHVDESWLGEIWVSFKISISPENKVFKYIEGEMIVAKSNPEEDNFDILVFADQNIEKVTIPSFIKTINSYSFFQCRNLNSIEFSECSELTSINKYAFCWTRINNITIPPNVTFIGKEAFSEINSLETVNFSENSKLKFIEKKAFTNSNIKSFTIPSNVEKIDGVFHYASKLNKIFISHDNKNFIFLDKEKKIVAEKSNPNSSTYDVLVLVCRDIKEAFIPSFIKKISSDAFGQCKKLETIEFSEDSQLETIGKYAFLNCNMKTIKLPSSVKHLKSYCFSNCRNLKTIEISEDSQLLTIGMWTFNCTSIENLYIPSKLEYLKDRWFDGLKNLKKITVSSENKHFGFLDEEHKLFAEKTDINNEFYDVLHFAFHDIEKVEIPTSIRKIKTYSFSYCDLLKTVTFLPDSKLEIIENDAFNSSSIEEISIPSKVNNIGSFLFYQCQNLRKVFFSQNSELTYFPAEMIGSSRIESFSIPSKVKELQSNWCSYANYLTKIELSKDNKNFSFIDEEKKLIVGKSIENLEIFDTLIFVCRDVKKVTIPISIKYISSYCFSNCKIDYIKIPKSVISIRNNAFDYCCSLRKIDFDENSDEIKINEYCFRYSLIKNIIFPYKKIKINLISLLDCDNLSSIEFLGEDIQFDDFISCKNLKIISMPNVEFFLFEKDWISWFSDDFLLLFMKPGSNKLIQSI